MGVLLIGSGPLADEVEAASRARGVDVARLEAPGPSQLAAALASGDRTRVTVVYGEDAVALRMALMVRFEHPTIPMLVTLFDPAAAEQLREADPHVQTTSMADIVAPTLAAACVGGGTVSLRETRAGPRVGRLDGDRVVEEPFDVPRRGNRTLGLLLALVRPHDRSAALLVYGFLGLLAILLAETIGAVIVLDQGAIDAFYGASKTLVTVDPNDGVAKGPGAFKLFTSILMLLALFFEALFTAGIVNRLIDRRLTGWFGSRAVPRRDHVVVVGIGDVGLRLCEGLRAAGMRVVAVDHEEAGEDVGVAREAGIPVVIGRGADPSLLGRLALDEACALAAVTPNDLENLSIAMAARSIAPDLRIVLRTGDGHLAQEARGLLRFAAVRDVHAIAAAVLAARSAGRDAVGVVCVEDEVALVTADGQLDR